MAVRLGIVSLQGVLTVGALVGLDRDDRFYLFDGH
jgi:hypothetical protein